MKTALLLGLPLLFASAVWADPMVDARSKEWREYLGGPDRNHYSSLNQINAGNVNQLKMAWEYHSGEYGQVQVNPIMIDGVLYGATASSQIFALEAGTGKQLWRYSEGDNAPSRVIRGVSYWTDGTERRIFFSLGSSLCALDARTGKLIASFGENGKTSLSAGLGKTATGRYLVSTSPGTIYRDLIVMPTRVDESEDAALGYIQAFNVRTGQLAWVFHTIPKPGEYGYETWSKDAYTNFNVGAANCWPGMAIDRKRGILYVPVGSASPDFWGGNRLGQDLFADCLLALDAATGKRLWHYQFIHHDLWDRDPPAAPNLVTLHRNGKAIDAVAQITKQGFVFVFDRVTGEPLFPIQETPVSASSLEGEQAWPTQPVPVKPAPYARQGVAAEDLNPYSKNRDELIAAFKHFKTGPFEPFNKESTLFLPGFDGGAEWGGAAADPDGILYVNETEMAWVARLVDEPKIGSLKGLTAGHRLYATTCVGCHGAERAGNPASGYPSLKTISAHRSREEVGRVLISGRGMMPGFPWLTSTDRSALIDFLFETEKQEGHGETTEMATIPEVDRKTPYKLDGYVKFLDVEGYPAIKPPWGTLNAIDLNTGEYVWKVTLGEFKELTARGIPPTGAENYGGPLVTQSGLLFIGATKDGMFRAFDKKTGKLLWETTLPAAGFATPCTYEVQGKQYIVIACGGTKLDTPKGDSYVAFALP